MVVVLKLVVDVLRVVVVVGVLVVVVVVVVWVVDVDVKKPSRGSWCLACR